MGAVSVSVKYWGISIGQNFGIGTSLLLPYHIFPLSFSVFIYALLYKA